MDEFIKGRLNRKRFIFSYFAIVILSTIMMSTIAYMLVSNGVPVEELSQGKYLVLFIGLSAFTTLFSIYLGIKRLHDMNRGGNWNLLVVVPMLLGLFANIYRNDLLVQITTALCFFVVVGLAVIKGTDGDNDFGSRKN